jgi:acyl-CoA thioester hydrolase
MRSSNSAANSAGLALFHWTVRVYYEDTDLAGVVYYANYLKFMERARTEWLRSLGLEQDEVLRLHGLIFVVASAGLRYRKPARFNDLLCVSVAVAECGRTSLGLAQEVTRVVGPAEQQPEHGAELLCQGEIRVACVDAGTFRPRAMPAEIVDKLRAELGK